ncbi:MAG TPA: ATP-binding protein [Usitatibacter sp.]|nr:ATP-binding protein [Usitatibacter sp.]
MRRVPLRRQLFTLAVAGILPLAILAGAGLGVVYQQQRDIELRRGLEITRALAIALEAELQRSFAALRVIAVSPDLDRGDIAAFREGAMRALGSQPHWRAVILSELSGAPLMDTRVSPGGALPAAADIESIAAAVATRAPRVGSLEDAGRGHAFRLRVPVVRDGELRYVASAVVEPSGIVELLKRQAVPEDWVISVFDARGHRVARSRAHEKFIGLPPAESLMRLMSRGGSEGTGMTDALEGDRVFTAFTRLRESGWAVAIGLPVREVNQAALRTVAVYGGAIVISILVALLAAYVVARRINKPMAQLREAAHALGRGGAPQIPESHIREVHEVGEALAAAAQKRLAAELEREQLLERETLARDRAEAANRAKDQFLAMLGHELRNPLAALSNAASLLGATGADERTTSRAREVIQRQVGHLARLTDDLLDAARALLGKIELRSAPVDLAAVASQAAATLAATGRAAKHRFQQHLETAWVTGDAVRLDQVVTNLLVNAVKFTPQGGTITLATRREGGEAVLSVSDTGIGLSRELAERAFDLFVQGERELDRAQGGLGIGLTLVRRLAELHGGSAMVHSEGEGRGSTFVVRIPAIEPPSVPVAGAATRSPGEARTVLIVEDNDDARETLQALLEMAGHRVVTASDGHAGLEKALAIAPDIALVDVGLPGIDGHELARRLRAAAGQGTVLVALTGYGSREDREKALAAGFDDHITKPVEPARVAELVAGAAGRVPAGSG